MASASMGHCEASLLWLARRKLGAVMWAANADVVLHRMQYLGGEASRSGPSNTGPGSSFSRVVTRQQLHTLIGKRRMDSMWVATTAGIGVERILPRRGRHLSRPSARRGKADGRLTGVAQATV